MTQSQLNGQATFFKNNLNSKEYRSLLNFIFSSNKKIIRREDFENNLSENQQSNLDDKIRLICHGGFLERIRPDTYKRTYITKSKRDNLKRLNNYYLDSLLIIGERNGFVYGED